MKVGELIDKYIEINTSMATLEHLKRGKDKYLVERLEKAIRLLDEYTEMIRALNVNNKMANEAVGPVKLNVAGIVEFLERRIQFLEYELKTDCLDQNMIIATKAQIAEATHILNTVKTMRLERKESDNAEE